MEPIYRFFFKFRNQLAGIPLVYAFFSVAWEWEDAWATWILALTCCASGIAVRTWSVCNCNYAQGKKKELATTGPYAYVRNPLYIGNLLIIAGGMAASELVWLLPIGLVYAFLVYNAAIRYEESRLLERYGDEYLRYRERVPAWFPLPHSTEHPVANALARQARNLLVLLPFVVKELNILDIWPHH